ncbi:MAG: hypothetical protein ACOX9R_00350 [Armatimonadota bacterium]|jgi:hypothetical protein
MKSLVRYLTATLVGVVLAATGTAPASEPAALGVGFMWYTRSEDVATRLTSDGDFVDVILGGEKLRVFERVEPPVRVVCVSLALHRHDARPFPGVSETIEILRAARVPPERVIIGYNPERAPGTTPEEMDNLLESVIAAKVMAEEFGSPLLVGPGLREMDQREELYPELAKHCDIWLVQSQRLQMHITRELKTPQEYREGVQHIVERLREGNPEIEVFVQIVASGRPNADLFSAEQLATRIRAIEDLIDAVRIYGGSPELLHEIIDLLRPQTAADEGD